MIKRQMYGRAGFTLLRHRILLGLSHDTSPPKVRQSRLKLQSPSRLRITRVFRCVARALRTRATFMFAGGRWWRFCWLLMAVRRHLGDTPFTA